jgi:hypothetical protein
VVLRRTVQGVQGLREEAALYVFKGLGQKIV